MGCIACAGLMYDNNPFTLRRRESSTIPVEADSICPDRFAGLSVPEVAALPAFYGRRKVTLGDLFEIDGLNPDAIVVSGDLKSVKKIGLGMSRGQITVEGDVGPHAGAFMSGGELVVQGKVGDWLGAHMRGGRIVAHGDAAHFVGGAYSGELRGMSGGMIAVRGSAGREVGGRMRRGLIVVIGDCGEFAGAGMIAGSILVGGHLGGRAGGGMKRGTIVAFGEAAPRAAHLHVRVHVSPGLPERLPAPAPRPGTDRGRRARRRCFPTLRRRHEHGRERRDPHP